MDQLPRLGKRELICLLLFTCNYVVSVWRGFLFLWVLGMGYIILLWHSLSLPYYYFTYMFIFQGILLSFIVSQLCSDPRKQSLKFSEASSCMKGSSIYADKISGWNSFVEMI